MIISAHRSFKNSFKQLIKNSPQLQERILATIELLSIDSTIGSLKLHELTGSLEYFFAVSVNQDCRIIFTFAEDRETDEDSLVLIDIVSQDEVY
jgi:mRNA-degrading endonuclease YafQ of YafQ-DinJ toxin-antitoxin module